MCLIIFDWQPEHKQLLLAANRDEFHARPTQAAQWWKDAPHIYGGRDLEMGGTWLAVSAKGRFAAITNYRHPDATSYPRSRGELPRRFLESTQSAHVFARSLLAEDEAFAGYNLLLCDGDELVYHSNRGTEAMLIEGGRHVLSNHQLNTGWPKAKRINQHFAQALSQSSSQEALINDLLDALCDETIADDDQLPSTGVALDVERMLSPIFIRSPNYGTRSSTVLNFIGGDSTTFIERSFNSSGGIIDTTLEDIRFSAE